MKPELPRPPFLIAGLGVAGAAALEAVVGIYGPTYVQCWDANTTPEVERKATTWRSRGVEVTLGGDGTECLQHLDSNGTIIKSPGIALDITLLLQARAAGIACIDELEIGWRTATCPLVGVTGTNGKSTTCALIAAVLRAAARTCQIVGNTEFGPPLTAGAFENDFLVCEVSSFQLEASPSFLPEFAVFTNLTPEHLTRHRSMANYGAIKSRMFVRDDETCGTGIVNIDDPFGFQLQSTMTSTGGAAISYGFHDRSDVRIISANWAVATAEIRLQWQGQMYDFTTRLPGRHNAHNLAAAFAFGRAAGIDVEVIKAGIEGTTAPPGRWQIMTSAEPFDVIVDYAHTPDGIVQVLSTAQKIAHHRHARLHTVFGPVGLPDPAKAAGCAGAIAVFSDRVTLTTGSAPRSARVVRIKELYDVIKGRTDVEIVLSRRAAIVRAIAVAQPGDIVMILGIGALHRLIIDARRTVEPHDDRSCVLAVLNQERP